MAAVLGDYYAERKPNTDAIARMALENFDEVRSAAEWNDLAVRVGDCVDVSSRKCGQGADSLSLSTPAATEDDGQGGGSPVPAGEGDRERAGDDARLLHQPICPHHPLPPPLRNLPGGPALTLAVA